MFRRAMPSRCVVKLLAAVFLAINFAPSAPAQAKSPTAAVLADLELARRDYEDAMAGVRLAVRTMQRTQKDRYERIIAFIEHGAWPDNCKDERKLAEEASRTLDEAWLQCRDRAMDLDDQALARELTADLKQWRAVDDVIDWQPMSAKELAACNDAEPQRVQRRPRRPLPPGEEPNFAALRLVDVSDHCVELRRYRVLVRGRAKGDAVEVVLPRDASAASVPIQVVEGTFEFMATFGEDQRLVIDYGADRDLVTEADVALKNGSIGILGEEVVVTEMRVKMVGRRVPDALADTPRKSEPASKTTDERAIRSLETSIQSIEKRIALYQRLAKSNSASIATMERNIEQLNDRGGSVGRTDLLADLGLAKASLGDNERILARERAKLAIAAQELDSLKNR